MHCAQLFTICLITVALQPQLKVFAASVEKMKKAAKESMNSRGKQWNEKKCSVKQKKRGALDQSTSDMK